MSSELAMAYAWIDSTMKADSALVAASTGGIYQGAAPIGTQPPFTLYTMQASSDVMTLQAIRLWASMLVQIKAIGRTGTGDYAAMVTIVGRIDALFGNVRNVGLVQGGILACYRDGQIALDEEVAPGVLWSQLGGLYRIELQGQ